MGAGESLVPLPLPPSPTRGARDTGGRETLGPYVKQTAWEAATFPATLS